MSNITDQDIEHFIDKYFRGRNEEIKSIIRDIKRQEILSWAKIIFSPEFRTQFTSAKEIKKKLGEKDIKVFEELFIMIPLNYIYWRDCLKYEQLFPTTNQERNPICWAHAIASLIHLTLRRIISKNPPPFEDIKNDLVKEFGCHGMSTSLVLSKVLKYPKYNILHYAEVTEDELNVFNPCGSYHLYIATFSLTGEEWNDFSNFFDDPVKKYEVLKREDLQITQPDEKYKNEAGGHAVILIDHDSTSLTFLNSWGKKWADEGKFTIERGAIKMRYYDIYWYASELSNEEKKCFEDRQKKAVEAFYQILDYTYLLSTIEDKDETDVVHAAKTRQRIEVELDTKMIMKKFGDAYWMTGPETDFGNQEKYAKISINDFNDMRLEGQFGVSEKMIEFTTGQIKVFFLKIKNFLEYIEEKNYTKKQCIKIKKNKHEIIKDIQEERRVAFSTYLNDNIYSLHLLEDSKLIELMEKFNYFHITLKYPDPSFQNAFDRIIKTKILIKLLIDDVVIPNLSFCECKNLYFLEFGPSVTEICSQFSFCKNLVKIKIPNTVTKIGESTFKGCSALKEIIIPSSVTEIGDSVFDGCVSLVKIKIPISVTQISKSLFKGCNSLTKVTILSSLTQIDDYAFCECSSLSQIALSSSSYSSLTRIGKFAFKGCSSKSFKENGIPSSVTQIDEYAFGECSSLTKVTIPSSVTQIGKSAFRRCSSLLEITIPSSVKQIDDYVFGECTSLKEVTILASATKIGNYVFNGCSSLEKITIPSHVTQIGDYAFNECSVLKQITIPSSLTQIGKSAFRKCSSLTNIAIPSSVTQIGDDSFDECSLLKQISLPSSLTQIGKLLFNECSSLTKVTIPSSATQIGDYAFLGCTSLTELLIPSSVKRIGNYALYDCSSLTKVTMPSSVNEIGDFVFKGCSLLTQISIPTNVKKVGDSVFKGCSSLTQIIIPSFVTQIGDFAFSGCSSLTKVTIPSSVIRIGNYAFDGCSSLIEISIPSSVNEIGDSVFKGCSSLTKVTIPSSVTHFGKSAFKGCKSLSQISIPSTLTQIGDNAFAGCSSLSGLSIPSSILKIGDFAFLGCSSLNQITIPASLSQIGYYAFPPNVNLQK